MGLPENLRFFANTTPETNMKLIQAFLNRALITR